MLPDADIAIVSFLKTQHKSKVCQLAPGGHLGQREGLHQSNG
jgi:hypothetical protein